MNTEELHKKYPIGSRWLLPVRVIAHSFPEPDDFDPRPVTFSPIYEPTPHLFPKVYNLDDLQPFKGSRFYVCSSTLPLSNGKTSVTWTVHNSPGSVIASFVAIPGEGLTPATAREYAQALAYKLNQEDKPLPRHAGN